MQRTLRAGTISATAATGSGNSEAHERVDCVSLQFSGHVGRDEARSMIESGLEQRRKGALAPRNNCLRTVFFIDDVALAGAKGGALEVLRHALSHGSLYSAAPKAEQRLLTHNVGFLAAATTLHTVAHTVSENVLPLPSRLARQFVNLSCEPLDDTVLTQVRLSALPLQGPSTH